jgi:hypothetical protein
LKSWAGEKRKKSRGGREHNPDNKRIGTQLSHTESPLQKTKMADSVCELEEAVQDRNYVRAVRIAESIGKPAGEIRELQQEAIKQFIVEFRNPQGAIALAEEYHFVREDVDQLLRGILQEAEGKEGLDRKQYDIKTMRYLTLGEWIKEYFKIK